MTGVEIELANGEVVGDAASVRRWHDTRRGPIDLSREDAEPVTVEELLAEEHHRFYGRPWALGRAYADHLLTRGIAGPLLDFGCGAGRVGIWLIPELGEDGYFGIESHLRSLQAFARYEIPLHRLERFRPRLMLDNEFNVERFGVQFEAVLDLYVSHHLGVERAEAAYRRIRGSMRPGGRVFQSDVPLLPPETLERIGLELTHVQSATYPLLEGSSYRATDEWHELTAV